MENAKDGVIQVTEIIEENNYYPFGLKHKGYNELPDYSVTNKYKYAFGGKELNDELGLNLYDFGARNYDAAIGRWLNMDPLAENSRRWTPYNYAYNNPIVFVDPDGMQADKWVNKQGQLLYDPTANNGKGDYTKDATKQDKKIGNNLQKTSTGQKQFNKLISSEINTTITVHKGKGPSEGTEEYRTGYTTLYKENGEVQKADIDIYEGRIQDLKDVMKPYFERGLENKLNIDDRLHYNVKKMEDNVSAVIGHEIDHAVDKDNQALPDSEAENIPDQIESKILEELMNLENKS